MASLAATHRLGTAVLVGLYECVKPTDASFSLWALLLGLAGGLGAALHGGYDLAALQIALFLGRLILFDATNPVIVVPALLARFIASPRVVCVAGD